MDSQPSTETHRVYRLISSGTAALGRPDTKVLTQLTEKIPLVKPYEVLVRIKAVGLNHREILLLRGIYDSDDIPVKENVVPGSDMSGEVVKIGENVSGFSIGDRVTAIFHQKNLYGTMQDWKHCLGGPIDGVLQEYRAFEHTALLHVPPHLSWEEAACFTLAGTTAWNALYGGIPLAAGQTVLIQGTGGVSAMGLMLAHAAGAKTIITSSSDAKLEIAKKLGATHTINYKTTPNWDEAVLELTNGVGAHHIFDNVGIADIHKLVKSVAKGGCIDCIGWFGTPGTNLPDVSNLILLHPAILRGVHVGSKQLLQDLLLLVGAKQLKPVIDKVFDFRDASKAIEYLASGQHFGKVVITI